MGMLLQDKNYYLASVTKEITIFVLHSVFMKTGSEQVLVLGMETAGESTVVRKYTSQHVILVYFSLFDIKTKVLRESKMSERNPV